MMRTIAKRISEGSFTSAALAKELSIDREALMERIFMMERMGYIVREDVCPAPSSCGERSCRCAGCSCASGGSRMQELVQYSLTEKGKRLALRVM